MKYNVTIYKAGQLVAEIATDDLDVRMIQKYITKRYKGAIKTLPAGKIHGVHHATEATVSFGPDAHYRCYEQTIKDDGLAVEIEEKSMIYFDLKDPEPLDDGDDE